MEERLSLIVVAIVRSKNTAFSSVTKERYFQDPIRYAPLCGSLPCISNLLLSESVLCFHVFLRHSYCLIYEVPIVYGVPINEFPWQNYLFETIEELSRRG